MRGSRPACAASRYIEEVIAAENLTFLQAPSFSIAKDNLAWSWAQVLKLREWVLEHPEDMKARDQLDRAESRFDRRLGLCGLYPMDRAKLQQVLTSATRDQIDIAAEIERGRQIRLARESRSQAPGVPQGDGGGA